MCSDKEAKLKGKHVLKCVFILQGIGSFSVIKLTQGIISEFGSFVGKDA